MYLFDQKTVFLSQPRLRVSIISGVGDKYQVPFFIRPMAAHFRHHHRVLSSTLSPRWNAIYEDKQRHLGESNGSLPSAASMEKPTGRRRVVVQSETNKTRRSDTMRNNCPAVVSNVRAVTFLIDTASRDRCHFLLSPASDEIKKNEPTKRTRDSTRSTTSVSAIGCTKDLMKLYRVLHSRKANLHLSIWEKNSIFSPRWM